MKRAGILAAVALAALPCAADELKLKDGTKITGTIVGYEKDSFKVETSYGFALVRKDKVESITITDAPKKAEESKPVAKTQLPAGNAAPAPTPVPVAAPPPEPPMRESVEGTTYTNDTYGFRMYKPPSWRVIEGARKLLPAAIVAMGTGDEKTLLVFGRGGQRGSLDAQMAATERELRAIYENYLPSPPERTTVAGQPALQRRFQGLVEERQWSGMIMVLTRGGETFTILGMTSAETDLIQIQENVIAKTLASLEFFK